MLLSAPFNGVINKLPPRKLLALPTEDRVISIFIPSFAKAGSSACIATAATFLACIVTPGGIFTPKRDNMLLKLCVVTSPEPSPVPFKPTTKP